MSVSGDYGIVNQIEFQGRSFAGASVSNYGVVQTGDVVYTKSPLNSNPYGIIKTNKGKPGIVSTLYAVYHPKENAFSDFIQVYFEQHARMNNYMHPLVNKGAKNDMKVSAENALKGPVCFPSRIEQESISAFFSVLDNLITLHQRKFEKLTNVKKSMLEKMFPQNGCSYPEIRFKGFTDAWEQRKLGDCFTERCESMPDGELISVTINDGIKKFSELGRHDNSNDDKSKYKKVCAGDIAYNSMRMWQGASGCSPYEGIVSPAYTVLTPNSGINSKCMAYQFKLPATIHTFKINSQGITSDNWNLKFPALSEIEIYVSPYEQEQAKIAAYFANLDHLITLHQRKFDKLQVLKKAMLEKMFPKNGSSVPEIRFKGFTDAWEQRKLSEMCGTFEYGLNAAAKEFDGKNKYIRITDIDDASREFLLSDLSSPDICLDGMSKYLLSSGDIVFARTGASVGKTYIYRENDGIVYFAGFLIRAKVNQDNDAEFVFQSTLSPSYEKYIRITSQRSGQPGVNAQEYGEYDLFAPSKEEQQRIGHFLRGIDSLITLHQRELEKLQNIKKSMLEKMFV